MRFEQPLLEGTLIRRRKRFFADIKLRNGDEVTAHCINPGSLMGCSEPGSRVLVSLHDDTKHRFKHQVEIVYSGRTAVGIHAGRPRQHPDGSHLPRQNQRGRRLRHHAPPAQHPACQRGGCRPRRQRPTPLPRGRPQRHLGIRRRRLLPRRRAPPRCGRHERADRPRAARATVPWSFYWCNAQT